MADVKSFKAEGQLAGITVLRFIDVNNSNVVEYATQYMKFYDDKGAAADRRDAEFFWAYEVRNGHSKDDPDFDRLLSQVNSPANEEFWAKRMDPDAYQLRKQIEAHFGFWVFPREPTEAEAKVDPGLLILGDNTRSIALPGYNLMPLTAIEYSTFVLTLLMCNPSLSFNYATIVELWSTLVHNVYHFEKDDVKSAKLREMDFRSGTSTVPTASTTMAGQTIVQALGSGTLGDRQQLEQQLQQENALLKVENAELKHEVAEEELDLLREENEGLKHKVATLHGQLRRKLHR